MDVDYPVVEKLAEKAPSNWTAESRYDTSAIIHSDEGIVRIQKWEGDFAVFPEVPAASFDGKVEVYESVDGEGEEVTDIEEAVDVAVSLAERIDRGEF